MLSEARKATGRGLHIHVAEDRYDVAHSHHHYGKDPLERLAAYDLLDDKTLVAHGSISPISISRCSMPTTVF